jgi:hypothetical protein
MVRRSLIVMLGSVLGLTPALGASAGRDVETPPAAASAVSSSAWPVATSLRTTLRDWARRQGWPAPQFLTDADWPVDVPGAIPGSIETALKALAEGFGRASSRPRIELSINHVIVVSEKGPE